jgi:NADH pyrophosphatase NudC (nudix superfamily)
MAAYIQEHIPVQRCEHGAFVGPRRRNDPPQSAGRSFYCTECRLIGWHKVYAYGAMETIQLGDITKILGPERITSSNGHLSANKNEKKTSNFCPECGSAFRYAIEGSTKVVCSECSKEWTPRRRADADLQEEQVQ